MPRSSNGSTPRENGTQPSIQLYTIKTFAKAHGLVESAVYRLWSRGQGPRSVKLGRRRFIRAEDAKAWRNELPEAPDPAREGGA